MAELYNKIEKFRKDLKRRAQSGTESIEIREVHAKLKKMLDGEVPPPRSRYEERYKGLVRGLPKQEE
jgi:hypothetical protein